MEDTALEQYLILANGARGRAAVALVQQAISNPHLFHFGELIDHENISALDGSPDTKGWLDLLKIFAFGTYAEYKANSANLPQIDDAQAIKLKQLTVVSLACDSKVIPYDVLLTALELKDTRTLEDCIIEGMYAGLFVGKLDQKTKEFHVTETAGRDCKPGELSEMISVLKAWVEAAEDTSTKISDKIAYAEKSQDLEGARVRELQGKVDEVKKNSAGDMDGVQGAGHAEGMDMDDVRPKRRPKTRHPSANAPALRH
mmetsp:Transcript_5613/g.8340  ORF Transcript_5613/g.8340 Transcript_5613/m.8340 type:complete len:257 (+) Transcript_5613:188-958(+)|eukprot:CAMPEP_0179439670 /NCGR_PEP_ID=MMETSP0799-20121207/23299_1 /TAXON_ID=46947 /ORGANISM="Geminigera cryophila, Strain CCMP2564" /LENGTH=256 /DNA_ID=CAMNT_0021222311 /DNA_START=189 /DNA_END=959 /DNA_ORIENTATION=+